MNQNVSRRNLFRNAGPAALALPLIPALKGQDAQPTPINTDIIKGAAFTTVDSVRHLLATTQQHGGHLGTALAEHAATSRCYVSLMSASGLDKQAFDLIARYKPPETPFAYAGKEMYELAARAGIVLPTRLPPAFLLPQVPPLTTLIAFREVTAALIASLHTQAIIASPVDMLYSPGVLRSRLRQVDDTTDWQQQDMERQTKGLLGGSVAVGGFGYWLASLGFASGEASIYSTIGATTAFGVGTAGVGLMVIALGVAGYAAWRYLGYTPPPPPKAPDEM
jgi:hypothetical protein